MTLPRCFISNLDNQSAWLVRQAIWEWCSFYFHLSSWDLVLLDVNNIRGRQTDLDKKVSNYIKSLSIVIDDSQLGLEVNYWWRLQNLKESQVTVLYADWLCSCPRSGVVHVGLDTLTQTSQHTLCCCYCCSLYPQIINYISSSANHDWTGFLDS